MTVWIFTTIGFFSVTTADQQLPVGSDGLRRYTLLKVRARVREDIEALRDHILCHVPPRKWHMDPEGMPEDVIPIVETPRRDYPYRIIIPSGAWAEAIKDLAQDINYHNFKNAVKRHQGTARSSLYSQVWMIMNNAEHKLRTVLSRMRSPLF